MEMVTTFLCRCSTWGRSLRATSSARTPRRSRGYSRSCTRARASPASRTTTRRRRCWRTRTRARWWPWCSRATSSSPSASTCPPAASCAPSRSGRPSGLRPQSSADVSTVYLYFVLNQLHWKLKCHCYYHVTLQGVGWSFTRTVWTRVCPPARFPTTRPRPRRCCWWPPPWRSSSSGWADFSRRSRRADTRQLGRYVCAVLYRSFLFVVHYNFSNIWSCTIP